MKKKYYTMYFPNSFTTLLIEKLLVESGAEINHYGQYWSRAGILLTNVNFGTKKQATRFNRYLKTIGYTQHIYETII
jgi:hypothetical protein